MILLDRPQVGDGEAQGLLRVDQVQPAPLNPEQRRAHRVRVEAHPDGRGARDFFLVCACGWVSLPFVWEPRDRDVVCEVERVQQAAVRNRRIYEAVRHGA